MSEERPEYRVAPEFLRRAADIVQERVHRRADVGVETGEGEGGCEQRGNNAFEPSSHVRLPSR